MQQVRNKHGRFLWPISHLWTVGVKQKNGQCLRNYITRAMWQVATRDRDLSNIYHSLEPFYFLIRKYIVPDIYNKCRKWPSWVGDISRHHHHHHHHLLLLLHPWIRSFDLFRHRRIAIVCWGVHVWHLKYIILLCSWHTLIFFVVVFS